MATTKGNMLFLLRILLANLFRRPIYVDAHADLPQPRRWKWWRALRVVFNPIELWQSPPLAYPRWCVEPFWNWAQRSPLAFDPRHPSGPRAQMTFGAFYNHEEAIEAWLLYGRTRNDTWLLAWWPHWFRESGVLARVACTYLWEAGFITLWENSKVRTAKAMFGGSIGNHPGLVSFLKELEHTGLSQLEMPSSVAWSMEVVEWISRGRIDCVQPWVDAHAKRPKPAWHYLGDGKQLFRGSVDFTMTVLEIKRFEAWFPLEDGWSWAKVLALYGANVFGHEQNVAVDWSTMEAGWTEAAHISHQDGWTVPASALVRGIDWRLALCLGHPDWPSWTGPERIAALLMEPEDAEDVSIAGLV